MNVHSFEISPIGIVHIGEIERQNFLLKLTTKLDHGLLMLYVAIWSVLKNLKQCQTVPAQPFCGYLPA